MTNSADCARRRRRLENAETEKTTPQPSSSSPDPSLLQTGKRAGPVSCCTLFHTVDCKMPTDIMSSCRTEHFGPSFSKKSCDAEQKSGFLVLLGQSGVRKDVRVVVYRTSLEHFAVIYPRKRLTKPLCVVNLRNTAVERDEANGFFVRQKGYDNAVSARFLCSERDIEAWLAAFSAHTDRQTYQHQSSLPVLVETEES